MDYDYSSTSSEKFSPIRTSHGGDIHFLYSEATFGPPCSFSEIFPTVGIVLNVSCKPDCVKQKFKEHGNIQICVADECFFCLLQEKL